MNPVGDEFQKETKYIRGKMPRRSPNLAAQPSLYKTYPDAKTLALPAPAAFASVPFDALLKKRKSVRDYCGKPLSTQTISNLLWASSGIARNEASYEFRTAPSAGALYPIETYLVINSADELAWGVYHYNIQRHYLELLKEGDFSSALTEAALGQTMCADCSVVFIWAAVFERMKWKYEQRAYRYIYLDAGHIAQNLALAATSLGLGTCQIGALYDDEVNALIGLDGIGESVIYMSVVG